MSLILDENPLLVNAEIINDQDGEDEGKNVPTSISLNSRSLTCLSAMLSILVLMLAAVGHPADNSTIPGTFMSPLFPSTSMNTSNELVGRPFRCCSRGYDGPHGVCLLGDPRGICCGAEIALLCGAGSTCYLNGNGHPYCCGPGTSGCNHVCLDHLTRARVILQGGACNPISPQGFNVDGTVLYVDAPWNSTSRSYKVNGSVIQYRNPPLKLGTSDISMQATIIPHADGRVGKFGEESPAVLYSRMNFMEGTGFVVLFDVGEGGGNQAQVIMTRDLPLTRLTDRGISKSVQVVRVDVPGGWRARVPMHFKTLRSGLHILVFIDGVLANVSSAVTATDSQPVDIDSGLEAPLQVSPRSTDRFFPRTGLDASLADMSILSSAESCIDISALGRCPILRTGEPCMPICQDGLRIDDSVFYVNVPWDASTRTYRFSGTENVQISDPFLNIGTGDISLHATITPHADGRVGRLGVQGILPAVLYSRMNFTQGTGFVVLVDVDEDSNHRVQVIMTRDLPLTRLADTGIIKSVQVVRVDVPVAWRSGIPVDFKILRSGPHILVLIDDILANVTSTVTGTDSQPVDIDSGLQGPLQVSLRGIDGLFPITSLDASLGNMSILSSAESCIDIGSLGRCPIIRTGEPCMPVCQQGFRIDDSAFFIDAPWDIKTRTYRLSGMENIQFSEPALNVGTGDITLQATIIPNFDGRVGRPNFAGGLFPAILYSRMDFFQGTGLVVFFQENDVEIPQLTVIMSRNRPTSNLGQRGSGAIHLVSVEFSSGWRAGIPMDFRILRSGSHILVYIDNVLANATVSIVTPDSAPIDVDSGLDEPLHVVPNSLPPAFGFLGVEAAVANLSFSSSVETCIDLGALGMCPIMRTGESCMPVCHQGFGYDDGAYYIDAPWNTQTSSYRFDPTAENISVGFLGTSIRAGNFTMRATIIPLADNQVTARGAITGVVFAQIRILGPDMAIGFFLAIHQDPDPAVSISLFSDVGPQSGRHTVMTTLPAWRADVPVTLTITRIGMNVTIDVNGVQRESLSQQGPIDIDSFASAPLILNPPLIFPPNSSSDIFGLNVSLTNLSIQSFVETS